MPDISSSLSKREVNARQNTYTKSEIDLKDGAIQAIAEAAQTTADAAEKKNQEQDQLIAELQKSAHTHSNKGVLDKIEQPYTTAERDKLAGLENYTHPNYTAHAKGFYKVANDGKGHVTDAGKVTKKDITDLGIPGEDTNTTYELALPTYASQKEPPAPMLSLNGSDGSENKQTIPCAYTVLDDIVYKEFSGFKIGGKYRSVADLAFVIPGSARIYPWRITANIAIETPSGNNYVDLHYTLEITDGGVSIRRYQGNGKYYSGNPCATNDWAILSDLQNFSNPDRDVWLYRIGVPDDVFNKLTNAYCEARLVYQTGKNGDVVKPVSYYKDITFDENVHAMDTNLVYVLTKADVSDVAFTGSYTDLANKPTIPDGSKYLPLAGGKMTGDIDMQTNKRDILVGTHKANTSDGTAVAGGIIEKRANMTSTLPEMRSFVGMFHNTDIDRFYNLISVRHRNGYSDGNLYGMYIFSESTMASADLKWGKQTKASGWTNDFTLLDSRNYTNYALTKDGTAVKANALSAGHMKYGYVQNSTTTAGSGYTWARVAYCEDTVGYDTITMTLLATSGHDGAGLFSVSYRNSSTGKACDWIRFEQIFTNKPTGLANAYFKFVAVYTDSGVRYEIWHNTQVRWSSTQFTCLAEQAYAGSNTNRWIFEKHDATTFQTAPPTGNKEATYYNNGVVNTATTLTDSGWVAMTVEGYAKSGTVKYRTYGKQITITGSVVLKNDIATSYPAPQYIASTTFDFSKIVGCSGVGRSSSGVGAYAAAENYNGDNLVFVYALGSKIAAGATLHFTITGFID